MNIETLAKRYAKLPAHWRVVTLGDVLSNIIGGGTPSRNDLSYWGGDIPWLTVKDMRSRRPAAAQEHITTRAVSESATSIIPPDTVITATRVGLGKVVRVPYAAATGEHSKDITGVLQNLVRDGLLTQQNQRRWASYRVAGDSPQLSDDSPHWDGDSPHWDGDSPHWDGDSPQSSPQLAGDSPQLPSNSPQLDRLAGLSVEMQCLLPLAEPARKNKKLPVDQLKSIIQQLCEGRWLSTAELAALVDRDAEKLQSRFLTAMVREGILELRYPNVRNRPDQAYQTVSKSLSKT